jgi:DNA polymerase-4
VVVGGKPDSRGVVAAASYEARAFGLHAGMPLVTARRLCPQAIFIQGGFPKYRDASREFMDILGDFSPSLEPMGLDEAYLDVTGFESIHGSIREMALAIKRRINDELGLPCSVGIANSKVVAKIACELAKPDGLREVAAGEERSFLAPLPITSLPGIGKKTSQKLRGLGIRTIEELAAVPLSTLKSQFGVFGEFLHRHASGIDDRPVEPPGAAKSISREITFAQDTGDPTQLKATLTYLSERVGADLRRKERQAGCVTIKLRYADFSTITRRQTLDRTAATDQVIFTTGMGLLKKALDQKKQAVRLIGIGVTSLTEAGRQLDMLDPSAQRLEKLNQAVDRIRKKYGFAAIRSGRTLPLKDIFPKSGDGYRLNTPG